MLKKIEIWFAEWDYRDRLRECYAYGDQCSFQALERAANYLARLKAE